MEAARSFLYSPPSFSTRIQLKSSSFLSPSSSAVSMFHEQAAPIAAASIPVASVSRHFPTSVLAQEQHHDCRAPLVLQFFREDKSYQEETNEQLQNGTTLHEGKASSSFGGMGSI
ncbi:uncharacterized protein LOC120181983 [Hibiscus syriacus]|uniref:uncharacterized protein LOC120181983 n=1 Tax=Hibiscus syriacus TaxID=106335 RepID=UPI0019209CAC|nr:uncharacterized protein LOC120181983 [Hibiscus syriacus]XP_039042950.1 uncharacterized protein LOC120181983 [Hibiscus syriacus]